MCCHLLPSCNAPTVCFFSLKWLQNVSRRSHLEYLKYREKVGSQGLTALPRPPSWCGEGLPPQAPPQNFTPLRPFGPLSLAIRALGGPHLANPKYATVILQFKTRSAVRDCCQSRLYRPTTWSWQMLWQPTSAWLAVQLQSVLPHDLEQPGYRCQKHYTSVVIQCICCKTGGCWDTIEKNDANIIDLACHGLFKMG